jgi:hypothetical protein
MRAMNISTTGLFFLFLNCFFLIKFFICFKFNFHQKNDRRCENKRKKEKRKKGIYGHCHVTELRILICEKKILIDWLIDWRKQEYRMMLFPRFFPTIFLAISPEIIILFLDFSATRLRSGMVMHEISESLLLILVKAFYV